MFLKSVFENTKINHLLQTALFFILLAPGLFQFIANRFKIIGFPCNHIAIARDIIKNNAHKLETPEMLDAIFVNCLLPDHYEISYTIKPGSNDLTIYNNDNTIEKLPVLHNDLILIY